ncbi:Hypothetical predicted protein [Pelobates cultripes]|uniref:Uncharacterized protein n=1 Tax=Pelobates cultripes TaxID=61616 RepID=A0AAD1SRG6_PELCU|nr:Hypothetical predicted protein [Pelobates cultripes]
MAQDKLNVSVTSRAAQNNAAWFMNHLKSHRYRGLLGQVTYLPISNSNAKEWKSGVKDTTFAILYHTKCQGRINLTDVTDSIYDKELKYMSEKLGKQNVLVVVDDLEKSDNEESLRILQNQPSISKWARDLLLFNDKEKDPVPEAKQQVLLSSFSAGNIIGEYGTCPCK